MKRLITTIVFLAAVCLARTAAACPTIDGLVDVNCDGKLIIEAFGDSITYGDEDNAHRGGYPGRLRKIFPSARVRNYGVSGEDTPRGKRRARKLFPQRRDADYIILLEGVNDYWDTDASSSSTKSRLFTIAETGADNGAVVLLGSLTRVNRGNQKSWVSSVNNRIRRQVDIDFYSLGTRILSGDGLHPNARGYDAMAALAANKLLDLAAGN
jgi:lysophospholipase L1-like esterase